MLRHIAAADASQSRPKGTPSLQQSMLQPVQGLILDSAPCRLTPDVSARSEQRHQRIADMLTGALHHVAAPCKVLFIGIALPAIIYLQVARHPERAPEQSLCTYAWVWLCTRLSDGAPHAALLPCAGDSQQQFCPSQQRPLSNGILGLSVQRNCFSHLFCGFRPSPIGRIRSASH